MKFRTGDIVKVTKRDKLFEFRYKEDIRKTNWMVSYFDVNDELVCLVRHGRSWWLHVSEVEKFTNNFISTRPKNVPENL